MDIEINFRYNDKEIDWKEYEKMKNHFKKPQFKGQKIIRYYYLSDIVRAFLVKDKKHKRKIFGNGHITGRLVKKRVKKESKLFDHESHKLSDIMGLNMGLLQKHSFQMTKQEGCFKDSLHFLSVFGEESKHVERFIQVRAAENCLEKQETEEYYGGVYPNINYGELYGYPEEDIKAWKNNNSVSYREIVDDPFVKFYTSREIPPSKPKEDLRREAWNKHKIVEEWDEDLAEYLEDTLLNNN